MKKMILSGLVFPILLGAWLGIDDVRVWLENRREEVRNLFLSQDERNQSGLKALIRTHGEACEKLAMARAQMARYDRGVAARAESIRTNEKALENEERRLEAYDSLLGDGRSAYIVDGAPCSRGELERQRGRLGRDLEKMRGLLDREREALHVMEADRTSLACELEEAGTRPAEMASEIKSIRAEMEANKARRAIHGAGRSVRDAIESGLDTHSFDARLATLREMVADDRAGLDFESETKRVSSGPAIESLLDARMPSNEGASR